MNSELPKPHVHSLSYRGMTRDQLDHAYNNVKADPCYQTTMTRFKDESARLYESVSVARDIAYGSAPRQRIDWISCGLDDAPTFVFIHGGYWQNYAKEDLAFVSRGPLGSGFNVVLVEYTLAPAASMSAIVQEIGSMLDYLDSDNGPVGFNGRPVVLCGHSAGGQLASLYRGHRSVTLTVAISGLFDLRPIAKCWLNEKLNLTEEEVLEYSPLFRIGYDYPGSTIVSVGESELPELIRQSQEYSAACDQAYQQAKLLTLPGMRHFTILDDLSDPSGAHMSHVARELEASKNARLGHRLQRLSF